MVGPASEETAAVRRGSRLVAAGANLGVPFFAVVVRRGYGLGAQAMAAGSFRQPNAVIAWPTAEFGAMGIEGAVRLGFRKELEAAPDRPALEAKLIAAMVERGRAESVAAHLEIDAVIDPRETRAWLLRALAAAGPRRLPKRGFVDVW
jgi:acetyl-CoA carboxylase carboxyltransferase component